MASEREMVLRVVKCRGIFTLHKYKVSPKVRKAVRSLVKEGQLRKVYETGSYAGYE